MGKFTRGGFFIHGGKYAGSAGCIDLTNHIDRFVENLRSEIGSNPNCYIILEVAYQKQRVVDSPAIPIDGLIKRKKSGFK